MTKIKNITAYPFDLNITDDDYLIGSDGDTQDKVTKNYPIGLVRDFMLSGLSPLEGGTLRIVEFVDVEDSTYTTPEDFLNNSFPIKTIEQYQIAIVKLVNGEKYLLKKQDVSVGVDQPELLSTDFIILDANISLGSGFPIFKGINTSGKTEYRTVNKSGNLVTVSLGNSDQEVVISINEDNLATFIKNNQKNITSNDNSVTIIETSSGFDLSLNLITTVFIDDGQNTTVSGDGSSNNPYQINVNTSSNTTVITSGDTTEVTGSGTNIDPYRTEVKNLQGTISVFPYTLLNSDDKKTLFINNGPSDVVINVPASLPSNFSVAFIQKGTGDVTFNPVSVTLNSAVGFKIKGQNYWALIEKELGTNTYYLIGSTKV